MAAISPLHTLHEQAEASFLYYGAAEGGAQVVETFGELEAEYAAIRKGCLLLDLPQRAIIEVTGDDRHAFLNRMLTQELKDLRPFQSHPSFWLNRKGRIDADLRVTELPDRTLLSVDILAAPRTVETLDAFVIADDVTLTDLTDRVHTLALHGPKAPALLAAVSTPLDGPPIADLAQGQATLITIADHTVRIDRVDQTAEPGFDLHLGVDAVPAVYRTLLERGLADTPDHAEPFRLRQGGWHAFNIARIEAGTPYYNIDFGPDSLPAETGVQRDRVSFTKGCYLGQEVVARLDALGKPKKQLVALRIDGASDDHQPTTGAPIFAQADDAKPIGAVTSSTRSPMLSDAIIALAQVKHEHTKAGTQLTVTTDAGPTTATVQDTLRFWPRG